MRITLLAALAAVLVAAPAARAAGLPSGAPRAATDAEPTLPAASGWPFPEGFPRTSGTSRLDRGTVQATDFVYDDHGATGNGAGILAAAQVTSLAPVRGSYVYPPGPAHGNGADIFRSAIGLSRSSTYWRVDWTTLADANVPIAEWALDSDANAATGATAWPAGAGLSSPGIDRAIVVSARGAWLIDVGSGKRTDIRSAGGSLTVDKAARSFVVRIPRSLLAVAGASRIRLAAGLASADGTQFTAVGPDGGALPGQPSVYNVAYRSRTQEGALVCPADAPLGVDGHVPVAECGNSWNENAQAAALMTGDVSKFSLDVDWGQLGAKRTTAEPLPEGYSVRWYVSRLALGQGVVPNDSSSATGDLRPNFLSRIQPYSVYVPKGYDPARKTPLTWILHSLGVNHNQYAGTAPSLVQEECEARHSICATTLGYGADGWYFDEAEVDFWQVWHALAASYDLDPDATVISGYSMGGYATYKLGLEYPDMFAGTMSLEGPPGCGLRINQELAQTAGSGHCAADGNTTLLIKNALWLPFSGSYGFADELVPITSGLEQVDRFQGAGLRMRFVIYPAEDHMVFAVQNDFSPLTSAIGAPRRVINPGRIVFSWFGDLVSSRLGIGPAGAYWVRSLRAANSKPGVLSAVDARSFAIPEPVIQTVPAVSTLGEFHPTPAIVREQTWRNGPTPTARQALDLQLWSTDSLAIDMRRARLHCGTVTISAHAPAVVTLTKIHAAHRRITTSAGSARRQRRTGHVVIHAPVGTTTVTIACK